MKYFVFIDTFLTVTNSEFWIFQGEPEQDENANETDKMTKEDAGDEEMTPAFPNGRRVSQVQTQCCNGFQESKACNIL